MSVSSISFWQQDQSYWSQASSDASSSTQSDSVISSMFGASSTLSSGLASLANQTALNRVNTQLTAAVQSALASLNGDSSSTDSTTSSSSASSSSSPSNSTGTSSSTAAAPAVGTGTVPLTASTSLFTLGIIAKGTVTVSDGTNTTTYTSTGSDTVGDLLNAINKNVYGNAQVAAWLNSNGQLVVNGENDTATISIGGTNAANVGFATGNTFFQPTAPSAGSSTTSGASTTSSSSGADTSSSSSSSSSSTSSTSTSGSSTAGFLLNSALALQTGSTAETLLSNNGLSGNIVNLLT